MHIPVLLKEVVEYLKPSKGKKFVDLTLGGGGHARSLVDAGAEVLGIDRDPEVISRISNLEPRIKAVQGNFSDLKEIAESRGFAGVDGVLMDLGLSSLQLDDPKRGFSFQKEGPLDMRFDQSHFHPASEIVNHTSEQELVNIFYTFGEEKRFGKKIARAILLTRKSRQVETTTDLFELIKKALPGKFRHRAADSARRIFQALRIYVNQELKNLEKVLPQALDILAPGGRLVVISFHSLEDRMVKRFFLENAKDCVCPPQFPICRCDAKAKLRILTKKPIIASEQEIKNNPRSKSAKMRAAEKIWEDFLP